MSDSIKHLEEKIAYLERHVTQQDKAMLEMADDIARLRREWQNLRARVPGGRPAEGDEDPPEERPPHY